MATFSRRFVRRTTRPQSMSRSAHERHRRVLVLMVPQAASLTQEARETLRKELTREHARAKGELSITLGQALNRLGL